MHKDCYDLFAEMEKLKLTIDDIHRVYCSIESLSLLPIAESIVGEKGRQVHKAAAKNIKYSVLVDSAIDLVVSMAGYYSGVYVDGKWLISKFFDSDGKFVDRQCFLCHSLKIETKITFGSVLEKFVKFKKLHADFWEDLLYENKKDFSIKFWKNFDKTKHINLAERNHFLVHSVDSLCRRYYQQFLNGVPVSCSVFDVADPWYYMFKSRRILLVYDTDDCDLLGASACDCTSLFSRQNSRVDINCVLTNIGMPPLWDFTHSFQLKPFVEKNALISQVRKHDPNDVGEVIVLGDPCAVIVREPENVRAWPNEVVTFAKFFELPVYVSLDGKLKYLDVCEIFKE